MAVFMREIVIGKWVVILTVVLILPLTVQADTTGAAGSCIFESRYISAQVGPEYAQIDLLQSIVDIRVPEQITTV